MPFGLFGKVPQKRDFLAVNLPDTILHPFETWLQTSLAGEHIRTIDGAYSIRLTPSAQVRLNKNISVSFNTRDVFTGVASGRTRTYSFQVQVKTVE